MEAVGGILLVLGVRTREVAAALIPVLAGALWVHAGNGWVFSNAGGGWEYPLYLIVLSAAQVLLGRRVRTVAVVGLERSSYCRPRNRLTVSSWQVRIESRSPSQAVATLILEADNPWYFGAKSASCGVLRVIGDTPPIFVSIRRRLERMLLP